MIVRRLAAPTAALMFTSMLIAGAGPAFGARGESSEERERRQAEAEDEAEKPVPCPEKFWTVPVQVEGLACVLLLPKDEADQKKAQEEEQENSDRSSRRRR